MEESGVMAVAAHSARHLAVPADRNGAQVNRHDRRKAASPFEEAAKRFHVPGTRLNTFNRTDFPVVWGLPRFKERPFLHSRAFIPSPNWCGPCAALSRRTSARPEPFSSIPARWRNWRRSWRPLLRIVSARRKRKKNGGSACAPKSPPAPKPCAGNSAIPCARCAGRGEAARTWPWKKPAKRDCRLLHHAHGSQPARRARRRTAFQGPRRRLDVAPAAA